MKSLLRQLKCPFGNIPIVGHRDLSKDLNNDGKITPNEWSKLCPNFDVKEWLKDIGLK